MREGEDIKGIMGTVMWWLAIVLLLGAWFCVEAVSGGIVEDVRSAPYYVEEYKLNKFDCTDMSAIMEIHLSQKGYDAKLLAITRQKGFGHAMVAVYDEEEERWRGVECTGKRLSDELPRGWQNVYVYEDIVDAVENGRWGAGEWGLGLYLQERKK